MTVSLWIRETVGGKRTYRKPNKKKFYPHGTVFCLRYSIHGKRRWETLDVTNLNAALAARATREAALLSAVPTVASVSAKRIKVNDAMGTYDARLMWRYPVSTRINHVSNDDEECAQPVESVETQNSLF